MEADRSTKATLVDLLDRVLNKGLVLDVDLIISVSGIPLLGVKLKTALSGIETMLEYGIWEDWDEAQRAYASEHNRIKTPALEGEEVLLEKLSSIWYSEGIYKTWRPGDLYVTDKRVLLHRKEPAEILFEAYYEDIKGFAMKKGEGIEKMEVDYLYLFLNDGEVVWLHPTESLLVKETIEKKMGELGLIPQNNFALVIKEDIETCPSCGRCAFVNELLDKGCKKCGWTSPRLKEGLDGKRIREKVIFG